MIQYNLTKHMERRGLTNANQLREFAGLTVPTAYSVLSGAPLQRIEVATLERLAAAFGVKPWTLLEWTPDP
jgi:transcriptional regulator with XRE-family HTH domain